MNKAVIMTMKIAQSVVKIRPDVADTRSGGSCADFFVTVV
jgi:hypothetical protein